ncbi:MAG: hypothetical protein Q8O87_01250 [bacterium]|nr:hypothetical protein [bacterium]
MRQSFIDLNIIKLINREVFEKSVSRDAVIWHISDAVGVVYSIWALFLFIDGGRIVTSIIVIIIGITMPVVASWGMPSGMRSVGLQRFMIVSGLIILYLPTVLLLLLIKK